MPSYWRKLFSQMPISPVLPFMVFQTKTGADITAGSMILALGLAVASISNCCYSVAQSCPALCKRVRLPWASLYFTISQSLLKLTSIELVMSNHLILCCPLLLLPSIFSSIWVFSNASALHIRWLKYWSFSISPSNEYSGLISFGID